MVSRMVVDLPEKLKRDFAVIAAKQGKSMREIVVKMLEKYVGRYGK